VGGLNLLDVPVRILDTRPNKLINGVPGAGPFGPGERRDLQVLDKGAVPLSGVAGIVANVTVLPGSVGGYLTIWPANGLPNPGTSNVNYGPAPSPQVVNQFTCALGPTGGISIQNMYGVGVHVIVDVQGWVAADELAAVGPSVISILAVPTAADSVKAAQGLTTALRWAMDTWWSGTAQTLLASDLSAAGAAAGNHDAIRRLGGVALGMSTALSTGLSTDSVMQARLVAIVDRVAGAHVSNALGGWGLGWQTSMWSSIVGRAAWLDWYAMPQATRSLVAKMVEREANFAAAYKIKYYRDMAGNVISAGDSGAEEVAWQGTAMQIALVMLPSHPNAGAWATEMARFALAAWARPADVATCPLTITGSNVEPNGQVANHGRLPAPDYSTCLQFNAEAFVLMTLAGRSTPQAMRQFLGPVYAALNALYVPETSTITYPQPNDWGPGQQVPFALVDALAAFLGFDTTGTAATYLGHHLDAWLAQQARHADGHTYEPGEYLYEGGEEQTVLLGAALWVALVLRDLGLGSWA
jgi:hypothetical protein